MEPITTKFECLLTSPNFLFSLMHLTRLPSWDYGSTSGDIISSVIVTKVLQMRFDYNGFVVVILLQKSNFINGFKMVNFCNLDCSTKEVLI